MKKAIVIGGAFATTLVLLGLAAGRRDLGSDVDTAARTSPAALPVPEATKSEVATTEARAGLIRGRVTLADGDVYEGRLRWGGDEEALWGNYFNGAKAGNPWVDYAPSERLRKPGLSFEFLGMKVALFDEPIDLRRPFMARFGDIARIDARGRDLRVTLKSGTVFKLDRYGADDLADGLRVWDASRGVVDIGEWRIRTVELLPASSREATSYPLYGTVSTEQGKFTGIIQWDREQCLGSDRLDGRSPDGDTSLRFDEIASIARRSQNSSAVTLLDGREITLSGTREAGRANLGIYVDDPRYGRVLVSWDAFERLDFSPGGTVPGYEDFAPGHALRGTVTTRSGRQLAGRLVYDLDESETTETLDAPSLGVDYTIPFDLIASIALPGADDREGGHARVILRSGEELRLELEGDLGESNAGVLIFTHGGQRPEYVAWADVRQVAFDGPDAADLPNRHD